MAALDHLAFHGSLERLAAAFGRLGFHVSPVGRYLATSGPRREWTNRSVFLKENWFDLIAGAVDDRAPLFPSSLLLRTDDLAATEAAMGAAVAGAPYGLERRWDEDLSLPPERFALVRLSGKLGPLSVAMIQHAYPCGDTLPDWFEHPNGAEAIVEVRLSAAGASGCREALLRLGDLAWLAEGASSAPETSRLALTIRVAALATTRRVLAHNRVSFSTPERSICVAADADVGFAWRFVER
jgi:hypothetical protein